MANLSKQERPITPIKQRIDKEAGEVEAKCAYLNVLLQGESDPRVEKIRNERDYSDGEDKELIRITLESEPQSRFVSEQTLPNYSNLHDLNVEKLQEAGPVQMKKLIKNLADCAKKNYSDSQELPYLQSQLKIKIDERKELEDQTQLATETLASNLETKDVKLKDSQLERKNASQELLREIEIIRVTETDIDRIKAEIAEIKRTKIEKNTEIIRKRDLESTAKSLENLVKDLNQKNCDLKAKSVLTCQNFENILQNSLIHKETLAADVERSKSELTSINSQTQDMISQNAGLAVKVEQLKSQLTNDRSLKESIKASSYSSQSQATIRGQAQRDLHQLSSQISSEIDQYKSKQKSLFSSKKSASSSIHSLEQEVAARENHIIDLQRNLYSTKSKQIVLEQLCCVKADLSLLAEDVTKLQKISNSAKSSMLRDLENGSDYALQESQRILEEASSLDSMIDSIDEKDIAINNLKATMGEVKKRNPLYVPSKDDPVDVALSEFLNTRIDVIPVPFTREDEGIYLFGTKRIFLKLEQGRIAIRVGGGYMSIDEFIEIYTPLELEKQESVLEEANPVFVQSLTRFSSAPSIGMSPQRASRIIKGTVEAISSGSPLKPLASPLRKVPSARRSFK